MIEQRYGIRVPGAPQELRVIERATGTVVARYDVHSTDGAEEHARDDLARLDAASFAATWCAGVPEPDSTSGRDDAARARLRADLRLAGGIAALAVVPLVRRLLRRHRGTHGGR